MPYLHLLCLGEKMNIYLVKGPSNESELKTTAVVVAWEESQVLGTILGGAGRKDWVVEKIGETTKHYSFPQCLCNSKHF